MYNAPLLDKLWQQYITNNPCAQKIHELIESEGESIQNDHIALRTCNDPRIGIESLAQHFIALGFVEKDSYHFEEKKLNAKYYQHDDSTAPKVFISELRLECFNEDLQQALCQSIDTIPALLGDSPEILYSGVHWSPLNFATYEMLLKQSEYAAWFYAYGFCANHFTVNVNELEHFDSIETLNAFLTSHDIPLNQSGGEIKGTPQDYLEQSSTMAEKKPVEFIDGPHDIPCCYYEFAKRYAQSNGKLYQGFVPSSADKIFESTDINDHKK